MEDNGYSYLEFMYDRYPRQFSKPERKIVYNPEELLRCIRLYQNSARCGCTIYDYTPEHPITLDRIAFDFDTPETSFDEVKRMHQHYRKIKHFMVSSGGGFHFYLYTKNFNTIKDPVATLNAAYKDIGQRLNVKCDPSLVANAAHHPLAIPGTFNWKESRQRYVIFITEDDLDKGIEHIHAKSATPFHDLVVYGDELFDIGVFARVAPRRDASAATRTAILPENCPKPDEKWVDGQPAWVRKVLLEAKYCGYRQRLLLMMHLYAEGYPRAFADELARTYFAKLSEKGDNKYRNFRAKQTLEEVFDKGKEYKHPRTETLKEAGLI